MGMHKATSLGGLLLVFLSAEAYPQSQWTFPLSVRDGQGTILLRIGIHPNGTDGFDPGLDQFAPPPAPSGSFDARLRVLSPLDDYITDIRNNSPGNKTWLMLYQASSGNGPVVISWDSTTLPAPMRITDAINGTLFFLDMSLAGSVSSSNAFLSIGLQIVADISVGVAEKERPHEYRLFQNSPNPFNPSTTIKYALPAQSHVTLKIYDILGHEIRTLVSGLVDAGYKSVQWDSNNNYGNHVASGVYFYRLEATSSDNLSGSFMQLKKMLLLN